MKKACLFNMQMVYYFREFFFCFATNTKFRSKKGVIS